MPVILATDAARRWLEPGPPAAELLMPYPAEPMTAWRVGGEATNSRIEPHVGMAEPVATGISQAAALARVAQSASA
jgi:putative SOS response-associated peptidase YedK